MEPTQIFGKFQNIISTIVIGFGWTDWLVWLLLPIKSCKSIELKIFHQLKARSGNVYPRINKVRVTGIFCM